jgi:hypothetical protein
VPALWGELRGRPVEAGWAQWTAWQKMSDLLADQANRMMGYQGDMEEAWPSSGTAAGYFHGRLAFLIDAMRMNSMSAGRIGAALAQVNSASMAAYESLRQLNEQWETAGREQPLAGKGGVGSASRRQELNRQAYAVMTEYEATVVEASKSFIPPEALGVRLIGDPATDALTNEGGGHENAASGPDSFGSDSRSSVSSPVGAADSADPAIRPAGDVSDDDPGLAGNPAGPPISGSPSSGGGSPVGIAPSPHPAVPVIVPGRPGSVGTGRRPAGSIGSGWSPSTQASPARRGLPVGGVIGGQPAVGSSRPGTPAGRGPLPPGGVVGGPSSGQPRGGTSSARGAERSTLGGPTGRRRFNPQDEYRDPGVGVQWSVAEGGPAVIEARPEPEHSPGPGVIGIDR